MPRARLAVYLLCAAFAVAGCSWYEPGADNAADTAQKPVNIADAFLPFGNPSNATADSRNRENYLLVKKSFAISYNDRRGTANWLAWRTTITDLGETLSRPQFEPDPRLPPGFAVINPAFYNGSGYDRGHLVPSADRFGRPDQNAETFQMTNIVPQAKGLNQYPWEKLERYARGIVRRGSDIYTIAGVYGIQGRLNRRIEVPTNCWKIIIVLAPGTNNIDLNTRAIAVDMPNSDSVAADRWQKYVTTIRVIEEKTGYNFLSELPHDLQDAIETRPDVQANVSQ